MGRPALREAIKALSLLDVFESRRDDGTYVRSLAALSRVDRNTAKRHRRLLSTEHARNLNGPDLHPVLSVSKVEQVCHAILQGILEGALGPGDRLVEIALAK